MRVSKTHSSIKGRNMAPFILDKKRVGDAAVRELSALGIHISTALVHEQVRLLCNDGFNSRSLGDAVTTPITTPSIPTPIQFLQAWLPGLIKVMTSARRADELIGVKTVGEWHDKEIVQGIVEPAMMATEYGDYSNIPLVTWNANFERRSIVRGELGMQVPLLEEEQAAAMRISSASEKRQGAAIGLEIMRNAIAYYGWTVTGSPNRTFGILNDPNLMAYATLPSGKLWSVCTFQEITRDIRFMVAGLRTQSQDNIDPEKVNMTLGLPTSVVDQLSTVTDMGISVRDWLKQTYPKVRVVSQPEFTAAAGSDNVVYLFADEVPEELDGSTDGGEVIVQLVQTKLRTLGVEKRAKSYIEDFANATAGAMVKRPWGVFRAKGI